MRQWLIDAFSAQPFGGNQAAVLEPLPDWPSDAWMQALAAENNLGATAFLVRTREAARFGLRWFTPSTEVPLCGHATMAAAHMLLDELDLEAEALRFETASGELSVRRAEGGYEMALPAPEWRAIDTPVGLTEALGAEPQAVFAGNYLVALLESPRVVRALAPDHARLEAISRPLGGLGNVGVAAMAGRTDAFDVIDRFFAPGFGLSEDPATGSFHALLMPILADRLGVDALRFHQAYPGRGAAMAARMAGDRVILSGAAVTVGETRLRLVGADRPGPSPGIARLGAW